MEANPVAVGLERPYAAVATQPESKPEPVPSFDNSDLENLPPEKTPWPCTSRVRLGAFELTDVAGRKRTDRELEGKVVIAILWTTWCGPCKRELSELQALYEKTLHDNQIAVVTLNLDDDPAGVAPFVQRHGYEFPALLARSIFREFPEGVPINWLADRQGIIRKEICGYGEGLLEALQKDALAPKKGEPLTPAFEKN